MISLLTLPILPKGTHKDTVFSRKGSAKTVAKQPTSSHVKCPVAQLSAKRPANHRFRRN